MKIISQKFNPLLKREEIIASIDAEKTPSRKDVISILAQELKTKEDLIILNKISGFPGKRSFEIDAFVYKNIEDIPKYELEKMKARLSEKKAEAAQKEKKGE
jgi:ribosomal protein S24E